MIVFNEEQCVNEILRNFNYMGKKWYKIQLIAIYYYNLGYSDKQIYSIINSICKKNFNNYVATDSNILKLIDNIISKAHTKVLKVPSDIVITEFELNTILSEDNYKFQKFLFTYLVLAKYYMSLNHSKDYYVGCKDKDLFDLCKMYMTKQSKGDFVHMATSKGYITPTLSLSSIVNYVNENGKVVMKFKPDDNLIYHFEQYLNKGKFINCENCSKLIKQTSNNQKYCKACASKIKNGVNY